MKKTTREFPGLTLAVCSALLAGSAGAAQQVSPPEAQAWIDVATYSGMGMPMGGNPMAALGGMFGGRSSGGNSFGNTKSMSAGRWVDVTVRSRANPNLDAAQQSVPQRFQNTALDLRASRDAPPAPSRDDEEVKREDFEKPRGRILLYWGCGSTIRPGQPRELNMSTASMADFGKFFVGRSATQIGAHSAVGRPVWPNPTDRRMVPDGASLVGEHGFSGNGIPDGFRFQIPAQQDLMPPLALEQVEGNGTELSWNAIPAARAYFASAMGSTGGEDMVLWTSSELPDTGFGLNDYQTNPAVDRWLKEKVLLTPQTTRCTVPKGVFGEHGAMLRLIAYGDELNLAYPLRPKDPNARWDPLWAVKIRVKSVSNGVLGMADTRMRGRSGSMQSAPDTRRDRPAPQEDTLPEAPNPVQLLKGIFGR